MYNIIHKQLYRKADEKFYLKEYDKKKHLVTYNKHISDAMKFDTCADAIAFIRSVPETIAGDMMIIPII